MAHMHAGVRSLASRCLHFHCRCERYDFCVQYHHVFVLDLVHSYECHRVGGDLLSLSGAIRSHEIGRYGQTEGNLFKPIVQEFICFHDFTTFFLCRWAL